MSIIRRLFLTLLVWTVPATVWAQESRTQPEPDFRSSDVQTGPSLPAPTPLQPAPLVLPAPEGLPGQPLGAGPWSCWIVSTRGLQGPEFFNGQGRDALRFYHFQTNQRLTRGTEADLIASLDPTRPVCFFIHGGYYTLGDVLHESRIVDNWLKAGGPMPPPQLVCFTWPSDVKVPVVPIDVAVLGRRSAIHGAFLATLINRLPPQIPVTVLGHSFGGRAAASTLHVLGGGVLEEIPPADYGPLVPRRVRGLLLVPAVDHHWFNPGERYALAPSGAEKILVMTNSIDPILPLYPLRKPGAGRAMGQGGLSRQDRMQIGPLSNRIQEFDIARISGLKHNLDGFYTHPELSRVVTPYVSFTDFGP